MMRTWQDDLYNAVSQHAFRRIGGKPQYVPPRCPNGDENRPDDMKYSVLVDEHARRVRCGHCFACGETWGAWTLATMMGIVGSGEGHDPYLAAPKERPRRQTWTPDWMLDAPRIVESMTGNVARQFWSSYKVVPDDAFEFYELGCGVLPASRCERPRLIVPFKAGDKYVGLRGRALASCACSTKGTCQKWMQSSMGGRDGRILWAGAALLPSATPADYQRLGLARSRIERATGKVIVLRENHVDCIREEAEGVVAIAPMNGAASWRDEWTRLIVEVEPEAVAVGYDYDHAGNGPLVTRYEQRYCAAARRAGWWPVLVPVADEVERLVQGWLDAKPGRSRDRVPLLYSDPLRSAGAKRFNELATAFWDAGRLLPSGHVPVVYYEWPSGTPFGTDAGDVIDIEQGDTHAV